MAEPAPGRIFISYRREETAYPASWLFDRLAGRFGRQVFTDVNSIELGDDFVEVITNAVGSCDVLLALIGDRWLGITDEQGRRRLDNPDDFVRLEIEAALAREVRVVPILVDGARMPRADELPPSLVRLARRQALELSPHRFDFDTSRLLTVLEKTLAEAQARPAATEADITPPAVPAGQDWPPPPSNRGELPDMPRRRLSTCGRILAALGVGVVLISLLIVTIVRAPHSPTTQAGAVLPSVAVIFHDDFSGRASGWNDDGSKRTGGHYSNGAYRVYAEPVAGGGGSVAAVPSQASSVYPSAPPNLRIEADARTVTGSNQNAGYGIFCHTRELDNGYISGYTFAIWDSHVAIAKLTANPPYYQELQYAGNFAVHENATNRIRAECTSDEGQRSARLRFWVNDQLVAEFTDTDNPFLTGTTGVLVSMGSAKQPFEAEFDNFVVMKA